MLSTKPDLTTIMRAGIDPANPSRLDRATHLRPRPDVIAGLLRAPDSRVIVHSASEALLTDESASPTLLSCAPEEALGAGIPPDDLSFLGLESTRAVFGLEVSADDTWASGLEGSWVHLLLASMRLESSDAALLNYSCGLATWRRNHAFCARCGEATATTEGGHILVCRAGHRQHPRVEPVVQMLVHDKVRCVLGRSLGWPDGWFSTLAGFVEVGETPEQAVVRETREETGLDVREAEYIGSQFWAGPYSLMLGFDAYCEDTSDAIAGDELERVEAFTSEQLRAAIANKSILVPAPGGVAGDLIQSWISRSR